MARVLALDSAEKQWHDYPVMVSSHETRPGLVKILLSLPTRKDEIWAVSRPGSHINSILLEVLVFLLKKKVFLASSHPRTKRASGARQRQAKAHRRGNRQNVCVNGGQRTEIGLTRPSTPPQEIWRLRRNEWPHNLKLAWDSSRLLEMQPSLLTAGINSRGLTNLARQSQLPCYTQKSTTDDAAGVNETAYRSLITENKHNDQVMEYA